MAIRASDYVQDAAYWGAPVPNGFGGYTYTRVPIKCRWENKVERFTDETGNEHTSQAVVFVLQDLDLNGYLYLGVSAQSNPDDQEGALPIRQFIKIPDLRNVEVERRAYL